ncbi:cytochrome c [Tropicimonas marinistellae]|uniref:cytochrome c n=1 Tax=Tropicimonas marinistellae TaxID=1739787 RepID=UPI00082A2B48|nr:cytochrome c [Tropicimonas marinistellae]
MGRFLTFLVLIVGLLGAGGFWLTRARPLPETAVAGFSGDAAAGRQVFLAAGCASCHADRGAEAQEAPLLSGGRRLPTAFGTFVVPNISPDPTHGIGGYSLADLAGVLKRGVTPDGRHLYPAMPYTTYTRMALQDVADLKAYLDTLPEDSTPRGANEIPFPYSFRGAIGFWKQRYLKDAFVGAAPSPQIERGRYLVEALGHCAECHTPRDRFGGLDRSRWMAGAANPAGRGDVPNITPAAISWSTAEMAWYLESGFSPDHEEVSREMESIIAGLSQLPDDDRDAIAAYLKGLAPAR